MFLDLPKRVTLIEVGPRDGFQLEKKRIPTDLKMDIICSLLEAGLKHIQVASFVHPDVLPQMADAEKLVSRLPPKKGVSYNGLVLNTKGVERAVRSGLQCIEVSISASDTHSRKNSGMSLEQAIAQEKDMVSLAKKHRVHVRAGIQCAFGCFYEGDIPQERVLKMAQDFISQGVDMLALSDTTGMADPFSIRNLMSQIMPIANGIPVVLHLHDTRGLGLVNVVTAMECGVTHFDTALAGMGGCPFIPGAAGNIATEDTAYLMKSLKIETGIDISKVASCSLQLEKFLGKRFPGKMCRVQY
jgi:hydroxymethylglutaryl-CoA lyase